MSGWNLEKMSPVLGKILCSNGLAVHLNDPDKVTEYLQGECCGSSKEEQYRSVCIYMMYFYSQLLYPGSDVWP